MNRLVVFGALVILAVSSSLKAQQTFTDIGAVLAGVSNGSVAWGDYDNDGDLDLAVAGYAYFEPSPHLITRIYRNDGGKSVDIGAGRAGRFRLPRPGNSLRIECYGP